MSAIVVAQELKLVRALAGNDGRKRNRVLKSLKRWLSARSRSSFGFTEHDFMRLWKGLFYCVWMSDKPLVQERLCDDIAELFECFVDIRSAVLFYKCFLKTMARDWFGIDHHRLDKFMMLVRRITRGVLTAVKKHEWSDEATDSLESCLVGEDGPLSTPTPADYGTALGLRLHLVDFWMEEIAKVSLGEISPEVTMKLVKPFALYLCFGTENRLSSTIAKNIFTHLIEQTDMGIEYREKELAWRKAGCPGGDIDLMERIEVDENENDQSDDEENNEKTALDPRAGCVDVILPQLPVDFDKMAKMLRGLIPESNINCSNRTRIRDIINSFEEMASGEYPLRTKNITLPKDPIYRLPDVAKAAKSLQEFERKLEIDNEDEELIGLNKKQKKRLMQKRKREGTFGSENEVTTNPVTALPSPAKKTKSTRNLSAGIWHIEDLKNNKNTEHSVKNGLGTPINKFCNDNFIIRKTFKNEEILNNEVTKENHISNGNENIIMSSSNDYSLKFKKNEFANSTPCLKEKRNNISKKGDNLISIKNTMLFKPSQASTKINQKKSIGIIYSKKEHEERLNKTDSAITRLKPYLPIDIKANLSAILTPPKKVNIALGKNTSHAATDYFKTVKQSPEIPFDSGKKPTKTSLKPNILPSPVNPFYKRKLRM